MERTDATEDEPERSKIRKAIEKLSEKREISGN